MRRAAIIAAVLIAAAAACYAAYNLRYPWYEHRFKLTIELDVDGETLRRSEVYQVRWARSPLLELSSFGNATRYVRHEMRGEALYFDLGTSQPLVITMAGGLGNLGHAKPAHVIWLAEEMLNVSWDSPVLQDSMIKRVRLPVPAEVLPLSVTFTNANDPSSMQIVRLSGNLESTLGRKVLLQSAWIEMTTEFPDEFTIERQLSWLANFPEWQGIREFVDRPNFARRRDFIAREFIDAYR